MAKKNIIPKKDVKILKVSDLKSKKEEVVTIEIIKDLSIFKIGDTKQLPKSLANQMVKLGNAKIINTN
jgi:hypothetical protein